MGVQATGLVLAFVLLVVVASPTKSTILEWSNIKIVLLQSSTIGLVAVPMALLMLAGHLDLSVGAMSALAAVVAAHYWHAHGAAVALLAAFVVALVVGLANGTLASYFGFSPIIVTLGGLTALRGIANQITGGLPEGSFGTGFANVGQGEVAGIPNPVLYCAGAFLLGAFFLYQTSWGRHTRALGVNVQTTFLAGIDPRRLPLVLYVVTALAAAFSGIIQMSRLDSASPSLQSGFEIDVLTAVLLGGVAFGGGAGSLLGVLLGVLFLGVLGNVLILNDVSPFWFQIVSGGVLVLAAGLARLSGVLTFGGRGGAGATSIKLGAQR
jgi:ribose/xylose/arabinose/galactoside ABC-type transport system permease subunit